MTPIQISGAAPYHTIAYDSETLSTNHNTSFLYPISYKLLEIYTVYFVFGLKCL